LDIFSTARSRSAGGDGETGLPPNINAIRERDGQPSASLAATSGASGRPPAPAISPCARRPHGPAPARNCRNAATPMPAKESGVAAWRRCGRRGRVANRRHRCRNAEFLAGHGLRPGRCGVAANPEGAAGAGDGVAGGVGGAVPGGARRCRGYACTPDHFAQVSQGMR